ncbi:MAG: hypothetical protein ABJB47_04855 [Actinomycetota bacterium]
MGTPTLFDHCIDMLPPGDHVACAGPQPTGTARSTSGPSDAELGWLHAVAHSSDTLRAFGRSPRLTRRSLQDLLELAVAGG